VDAEPAAANVGAAHAAWKPPAKWAVPIPETHSGNEMRPAKRAHMGAREAACLAAIEAMPAVEVIPASVAVAAVQRGKKSVAISDLPNRSLKIVTVEVAIATAGRRSGFVLAHQAGVADHVGGEDRGEPAAVIVRGRRLCAYARECARPGPDTSPRSRGLAEPEGRFAFRYPQAVFSDRLTNRVVDV
jgi:hypothetical protein